MVNLTLSGNFPPVYRTREPHSNCGCLLPSSKWAILFLVMDFKNIDFCSLCDIQVTQCWFHDLVLTSWACLTSVTKARPPQSHCSPELWPIACTQILPKLSTGLQGHPCWNDQTLPLLGLWLTPKIPLSPGVAPKCTLHFLSRSRLWSVWVCSHPNRI